MNKKTIKLVGALAAFLAAAAILMGVASTKKSAATAASAGAYEFAAIAKGDVETTVTSSGVLQTVSSVSVLAQMSGRVESVYADYNDHVKKGQLLVTLNTDMLELEKKEALADLNIAQVNYDLAALDYQNNATLAAKGLVSEYDLKSSKSTMDVRKASLQSAQSALKVIETQITDYARIVSPIDGIVLERDVESGGSVVEGSSSNATALFTIAKDLSKMEIKAEVDELDIGSVKVGQSVRFSVEANPGKEYAGTVDSIRLVPETTDNVVNYYVIVKADNTDGSLLPGMTANVAFIKEHKESVLLVPSAALRYQPSSLSAKEIARLEYAAGLGELSETERSAALAEYDAALSASSGAKSSSEPKSSGLSGIIGGVPGGPGMRRSGASASGSGAQGASASASAQNAAAVKKALWYLDAQGKLAVRMVAVGSTDGTNTEISGSDDLEGTKVIVRESKGQA